MGQETQVRTIIIRTDSKGAQDIKDISKSLGDMNKNLKGTQNAVTSLNSLAAGVVGASIFGFGVREVVGMADSLILLSGRLTALTGSASEARAIMGELSNVATTTKQSVTDAAEAYTRIATATINLHLPTRTQIELTQGLLQSFRLSGATAQEAAGATIQFAQALSFGKLSGQELRSVTTQNAIVAGILSNAIKGTGENIKDFAEKGGFTTAFLLRTLLPAFKNLDETAKKMSQTFAQTVTLAMNELQKKTYELNETFNLNGKFATFMQWILDHGDAVAAVLSTIGGAAGLAGILAVGSKLEPVIAALLSPIGLFGAALGALGYAAVYTAGGLENFINEIKVLPSVLNLIYTENKAGQMNGILSAYDMAKLTTQIKSLHNEIDNIRNLPGIDITKKFLPSGNVSGENIFGAQPFWERKGPDAMPDLSDHVKQTIQQRIGALNTMFNQGKIGVLAYNDQLQKLQKIEFDEKLKKGTETIEKMNRQMQQNEIEKWSRLLEAGVITLDQFNVKQKDFAIEELEYKFHRGKVSLADFNNEMLKLKDQGFFSGKNIEAGIGNYVQNVGTISTQVAGAVETTFNSLGDAIFNMTKKGQYDFSEFTQSVLDDLTRIVIKMAIVEPIAKSILGSSLFNSDSSPPISGAGSRLYQSPVPYAKGDVFNGATMFGYGNSKLGVMGERGPEAVMPLKRGADGSLGVASQAPYVGVTVNNYSSNQVDVQHKTDANGMKQIEVIVKQTVQKQMSNGSYDRSMQTNYGVQRKGQT